MPRKRTPEIGEPPALGELAFPKIVLAPSVCGCLQCAALGRFPDTNVVSHMAAEGRALGSKRRARAIEGLGSFAASIAIVAGAVSLIYIAGAKTPALGIALGAVFIILLALAYRRGRWTLIGPVFFFEMVRSGRQVRHHAVRGLYGVVLFLTLLFTYFLCLTFANVTIADGFTSSKLPGKLMGDFLLAFYLVFLLLQYLASLLLTPAYLAGAIAEERDRNTLEALLATDLRDREIALGIVVPRFVQLLLVFLVSMPIISGLQFLGGIDPSLILTGYAFLALTIVSIAGISVVCSLYARRSRSALLRVYALVFAYLGLSGLMWTLVWPCNLGSFPSTQAWLSPVTVRDVVEWCNSGNLISLAVQIVVGVISGTPLDRLISPALKTYAMFHGTVAATCTIWLGVRFRALLLAPLTDWRRATRHQGSGTAWLMGLNGRPPVFDRPMYWKELCVEGAKRRPWRGALGWGILLALLATPLLACIYFFDGFAALRHDGELPDLINLWVRWLSLAIALGMLMAIAVRAAGSVSGERTRDTLSGLLATPLTSASILQSKWLASMLYPRRLGFALALAWLAALATGAVHPLAVPCFMIAFLVLAGFVAALGVWFSVCCKTSYLAVFWTIFTLCLGLAAMLLGTYDLSGLVLIDFEAQTVFPPFMFLILPFSAADLNALRDPARPETFRAIPFVLVLFLLATWALLLLAKFRFRRQFNRRGDRDGLRLASSLEAGRKRDLRKKDSSTALTYAPVPWLRIATVVLLLGVPLAMVIGAFEYWKVQAHSALEQAIADADRLDPNWRFEEMEARRKEVPPEQNAALVVIAANKLLPKNPDVDFRGLDRYQEIPPQRQFSERLQGRLRKAIAKQQLALQEARKLAEMPTARSPREDSHDLFQWYRSDFNNLCSLLNFAAILRAHEGNGPEAIALCSAALNCARSAGDEVSQGGIYIRTSEAARVVDTLERVLGLDTAPHGDLAAMQALLEEESSQTLLQEFRCERAVLNHVLERVMQGQKSSSPSRILLYRRQPGFTSLTEVDLRALFAGSLTAQRAEIIACLNEMVEAVKMPEHLQDAAIAQIESRLLSQPRIGQFPVGSFYWRPRMRFDIARMRSAAVALACEHYRVAHGKWPDRLEELVPAFLQKVPTDPYDGQPIRFRRLSDGMVIYSVGPDGRDNGGTLERKNWRVPGKDVGFQLWDPAHRRQPAGEEKNLELDDNE